MLSEYDKTQSVPVRIARRGTELNRLKAYHSTLVGLLAEATGHLNAVEQLYLGLSCSDSHTLQKETNELHEISTQSHECCVSIKAKDEDEEHQNDQEEGQQREQQQQQQSQRKSDIVVLEESLRPAYDRAVANVEKMVEQGADQELALAFAKFAPSVMSGDDDPSVARHTWLQAGNVSTASDLDELAAASSEVIQIDAVGTAAPIVIDTVDAAIDHVDMHTQTQSTQVGNAPSEICRRRVHEQGQGTVLHLQTELGEEVQLQSLWVDFVVPGTCADTVDAMNGDDGTQSSESPETDDDISSTTLPAGEETKVDTSDDHIHNAVLTKVGTLAMTNERGLDGRRVAPRLRDVLDITVGYKGVEEEKGTSTDKVKEDGEITLAVQGGEEAAIQAAVQAEETARELNRLDEEEQRLEYEQAVALALDIDKSMFDILQVEDEFLTHRQQMIKRALKEKMDMLKEAELFITETKERLKTNPPTTYVEFVINDLMQNDSIFSPAPEAGVPATQVTKIQDLAFASAVLQAISFKEKEKQHQQECKPPEPQGDTQGKDRSVARRKTYVERMADRLAAR